jgi:hypothetical protein
MRHPETQGVRTRMVEIIQNQMALLLVIVFLHLLDEPSYGLFETNITGSTFNEVIEEPDGPLTRAAIQFEPPSLSKPHKLREGFLG